MKSISNFLDIELNGYKGSYLCEDVPCSDETVCSNYSTDEYFDKDIAIQKGLSVKELNGKWLNGCGKCN